MTDGWWRIKQHAPNAPNGFVVTEIPIAHYHGSDSTEPRWWSSSHTLAFLYTDGREEHFPWASIVHAEYQPPTQER